MLNSDPSQLLKNLSNTEVWTPLATENLTERDWIGVRNPVVLNARNVELRIIRIFKDRSANTWKLSVQGSELPEINLALKFEDNSLYQYILVCGKRVKVGTIYELPLLKAYKSTYFRQNRRFSVRDLGWYIYDLILPAEEINVQKRKSAISVMLETYAKLSPLDMKTAHFGFFQENDSALLRFVKATGKGFAMSDLRRSHLESARTLNFFSKQYTFVPLAEAVPDAAMREEIVAQYKTSGILSEAIFPISVAGKNATTQQIAYIRYHARGEAGQLTDEVLQAMVSIAEAVSVSVRNSNFERYPAREQAIDASLTGIKVQVRDPKVRKALSQISAFRATLYTGNDAAPLEVRLEKMQQATFEDVDYIGCRIADIGRKSSIDDKGEGRESGMKSYRAALSGVKPV